MFENLRLARPQERIERLFGALLVVSGAGMAIGPVEHAVEAFSARQVDLLCQTVEPQPNEVCMVTQPNEHGPIDDSVRFMSGWFGLAVGMQLVRHAHAKNTLQRTVTSFPEFTSYIVVQQAKRQEAARREREFQQSPPETAW